MVHEAEAENYLKLKILDMGQKLTTLESDTGNSIKAKNNTFWIK